LHHYAEKQDFEAKNTFIVTSKTKILAKKTSNLSYE